MPYWLSRLHQAAQHTNGPHNGYYGRAVAVCRMSQK